MIEFMGNFKQNPRKSRKIRAWGTCPSTGKVRYGERRDAEQEVEHAFHVRAAARLAGVVSTYTIVRAYRCSECRGYHTTSVGYLDYERRRTRRDDQVA